MSDLQLKNGFVLRKILDMNIVMPAGTNVKEFQWALVLNETGALIFELLQNGKSIKEIAAVIVEEYEVSLDIALSDIQKTINSLKEVGVMD